MQLLKRKIKRLLGVALALVCAASLVVPGFAQGNTVSLTFNGKTLQWGQGVTVDENGVAELGLFSDEYENVQSENGDDVVAPGTSGGAEVRLKNSSTQKMSYTAVLYTTRDLGDAVTISFTSEKGAATEVSTNLLPEEDRETAQIVAAYTGELSGLTGDDLTVTWDWPYEDGNDEGDTALGNEGGYLTVHLYIIAEADEVYKPTAPDTGDDTNIFPALVGLCACAAGLYVLARRHGKERVTE